MEEIYEMEWDRYFQIVSTIYTSPKFIAAIQSLQSVYPATSNDYILAVLVSQHTGLPIAKTPDTHTMVVSNVADTGETINKYKNPKVILISRNKIDTLNFYLTSNKYVKFPWESNIEINISDSIRYLISAVGGNTKKLDQIPEQMTIIFETLFEGYNKKLKIKRIPIRNKTAISTKHKFFSVDDDSGFPFYGTVHIAYFPSRYGIENPEDIVNHYSHQFTNVNKMAKDISGAIHKKISPKGLIVKVTAVSVHKKWMKERGVVKAMSTKGNETLLWKMI